MGSNIYEEVFHEALIELKARELGLIPEGVNVGENISFSRLLSRGTTMEMLNRGFYTAVVGDKNRWM